MTVDDRTRLNLHRKLEAVLGQEEADNLMAHLPPVTWNEVATKDDVATQGTSLRSEMHAMTTELRSEMQTMGTELRSEMQTMGTELRSEMHAMGAELRSEMRTMGAELRSDMQTMHSEMHVGFANLRADFVEASSRQLKWLVAFAAGWTSLLVTLVRFMP